jgi:competence protein ComEA
MNAAEKKFFWLALFLFALGGISRFGAFNTLSPLESVFLPESHQDTIAIPVSDSIIETNEVENKEVFTEKKSKPPKKKSPAFPLNINTASKDDLCFIKGVGPSLAQKIIDHRESKGSFRSIKDLEKVSGIGAKKRKSIEEFVRFD